MDLTEDDVLEILNLIEQSHFDYFQLQSGDLNLTVSKGGYIPPDTNSAPAPSSAAEEEAVSPSEHESFPKETSLPERMKVPEGLKAIAAPMVGTFYRAPEPGADPFVEVGSRIDADTTVGLVEVMKVFTAIPAGANGTISEIKVDNAQFVEKGAVLYLVTPDDPTHCGDRA